MAKKSFAVIGLGRFGQALIDELIRQDHDVLVMDKDPDRIQKVAKKATHAVAVDTTDAAALKDIGITSIDHVVVAIGKDIQASILTTLILKELGVKNITVKVQNEYHEKEWVFIRGAIKEKRSNLSHFIYDSIWYSIELASSFR
jgi:trk system potassium uptake protein TrkA